jgi:hypothetical protein
MFLFEVKNIFSNDFAFAALTEEGFVETWGQARYGGDTQGKLDGITVI